MPVDDFAAFAGGGRTDGGSVEGAYARDRVSKSRATLLGAPLAEEELSDAVRGKREELERLVSHLELIESHQVFVLIKNCFTIPKL